MPATGVCKSLLAGAELAAAAPQTRSPKARVEKRRACASHWLLMQWAWGDEWSEPGSPAPAGLRCRAPLLAPQLRAESAE